MVHLIFNRIRYNRSISGGINLIRADVHRIRKVPTKFGPPVSLNWLVTYKVINQVKNNVNAKHCATHCSAHCSHFHVERLKPLFGRTNRLFRSLATINIKLISFRTTISPSIISIARQCLSTLHSKMEILRCLTRVSLQPTIRTVFVGSPHPFPTLISGQSGISRVCKIEK